MMTMKQAQAKCRAWRQKGDKRSLKAADRLEAKFRNRLDYESDQTWMLLMQSGELVSGRLRIEKPVSKDARMRVGPKTVSWR